MKAVSGDVLPERRMIMVLGGEGDWDYLPDFSEERLCYAGKDVLYLMSASQWPHDALVTLEAWDGEPPRSDTAEAVEDVELQLTAGRVFLTTMGVPTAAEALQLPGAGSYRARVEVTGRADVVRRHAATSPPPWLTGVERFRVCFWRDRAM